MQLKLIVGLQNDKPEYAETRHNAGAWFLAALAEASPPLSFKLNRNFNGYVAELRNNHTCYCFLPHTFMNTSGQPVRAIAQYYDIQPESILIVHDDLDLPVGTARLKSGGGHGGHNGLRDVIQHLGSAAFQRLRIGIGHPGEPNLVHDYVLSRPSRADKQWIDNSIEAALSVFPLLLKGEWDKAVQNLHTGMGSESI